MTSTLSELVHAFNVQNYLLLQRIGINTNSFFPYLFKIECWKKLRSCTQVKAKAVVIYQFIILLPCSMIHAIANYQETYIFIYLSPDNLIRSSFNFVESADLHNGEFGKQFASYSLISDFFQQIFKSTLWYHT